MNSLREEIFSIIYRDGDVDDYLEQCTNLIFAEIKKRIDKKIAEKLDNQIATDYNAGYYDAGQDVKEILK